MTRDRLDLVIIKKFEGFSLRPYLCPKGKLTIGWGHVVLPHERHAFNEGITRKEAETLLAADVGLARRQLERFLAGFDYTEAQLQAMTSLAFNIGTGAFRSSTLLRKVKREDFAGAADEFNRWVFILTDNGKVKLRGLVDRRLFESYLFRYGGLTQAMLRFNPGEDSSLLFQVPGNNGEGQLV